MSDKTYSKQELINGLKNQLSNNSEKSINALLEIYKYQTLDEQKSGYTKEFNGVGFSGVDSEFLSSLAENYKRYGRLSEKQISYIKKCMPKYARQLLEISISKGKIEKISRGKYIIVK